jgi:hypothetical protein
MVTDISILNCFVIECCNDLQQAGFALPTATLPCGSCFFMSGQTVFADSYRSEDHANHDEEI